MATDFEIQCALMAGAAYVSNRPDKNTFPSPIVYGWAEIKSEYVTKPSGFEAISFINGDEIVISFAGTNGSGDWPTNFALAGGNYCEQLLDAARYYLNIKNDPLYAGKTITLTGHSLGGGLAELMAVFFDVNAVTFDQAPFEAAATRDPNNPAGLKTVAQMLYDYLKDDVNYKDYLAPLKSYVDSFKESGSIYAARESKVTGFYVEGEVLTDELPYTIYNVIGTQNNLKKLELTPESRTNVEGWDLHSIALLNAFLLNPDFEEVTKKLTNLLSMIFDEKLYYRDPNNKRNAQENFLERLIRHQQGVAANPAMDIEAVPADDMLTRFTDDLKKLSGLGDLTLADQTIVKSLTAFAMQMYYENPNASGETNKTKELFDTLTGGIHFDRRDVAATLNDAKGYDSNFRELEFLPGAENSLESWKIIKEQLPNMLQWYVQLGDNPLTATAVNEAAFMLGGTGSDNLTGGTANDLLVGGKGDDLLDGSGGNDTLVGNSGVDHIKGGAGNDVIYGDWGNDILEGGADKDTYIYTIGDGNDTIIDIGDNEIKIYGDHNHLIDSLNTLYRKPGETIWENVSGSVTLSHNSPWTITLQDGSTINLGEANIEGGDFGINLINTPTNPMEFNTIDLGTVDSGNTDHRDSSLDYLGTSASDKIIGGSGNDVIVNGGTDGGNDLLVGAAGNDFIQSFSGNNAILEGDAGLDALMGAGGSDQIFCGTSDSNNDGQIDTMEQAIAYGETATSLVATGDLAEGGTGGNDFIYGSDAKDALFGEAGTDLLAGGGGDDIIYGDGKSFYIPNNGRSMDYWNWSYTIQYDAEHQTYEPQFSNINFLTTTYEGGDDVIYGGSGNDYVDGGAGDDEIYGGIGNDTVFGDIGYDFIEGGAGDDVLVGDNGGSLVASLHGGDYIDGGAGNDYIQGDGGNDELFGGEDNDTIYGGEGDDYVDGEAGLNLLYGEGGNDEIAAGKGNDVQIGCMEYFYKKYSSKSIERGIDRRTFIS